MREFVRTNTSLARLSSSSKWLYGSFLVLIIAGFLSSVVLYYGSMGLGPSTAAQYFVGNADDPSATQILLEKSFRQLMETAHFHLFTMPVLLLILGHLFLLGKSEPWRTVVVVAAAVVTALHVAGPFVVRYGGAGFGWVMPATGIPFLLLYLFLAVVSLRDLLSKPPPRPSREG